jgi:hypothetical protein
MLRSFIVLGFGKEVVNPAGVSRSLAAEIYHRHAAALYGQALLILGDEDMAGQVACDVIVGECARPLAAQEDAGDASRRLAGSGAYGWVRIEEMSRWVENRPGCCSRGRRVR